MGFLTQILGLGGNRIADVDANAQLKVGLPTVANAMGVALIGSQNDDGTYTGNVQMFSPETDADYRMRVSEDCMLEEELFNYTSQNTGKHTSIAAAANLAPSWTAGGYNTNPTGVVTASSGATLQSYKFFPQISTGTLSLDMEASFSAAPTANSTIDFGLFLGGASNPFAPTDGVYFRLGPGGLYGVLNYGGVETTIGPFPASLGAGVWGYALNQKYQFIVYTTNRSVEFWINSGDPVGAVLAGIIPTPVGQGSNFMSAALPFRIRHAIVGGAAGAGLNMILSRYSVRIGGVALGDTMAGNGSRLLGAYEGLSGGTVGSLMGGTVSSGSIAAPTAAVPTNTTNALGIAGLGGLVYETPTLAIGTDGIIIAYQVPAGSTSVQGRRMKVNGVSLASFIQAVLTGGPLNIRYYLAFGGTTVSLATAESATAKAARRVNLPFVQTITAAQAVSTAVAQNVYSEKFVNPIYVNPGEWVMLVSAKVGTAITAGTIAHQIGFDYSWE
jgi:hypothetical protein